MLWSQMVFASKVYSILRLKNTIEKNIVNIVNPYLNAKKAKKDTIWREKRNSLFLLTLQYHEIFCQISTISEKRAHKN